MKPYFGAPGTCCAGTTLTAVSERSISATFVYDAEGNQVQGTVGGVMAVYSAGLYGYADGAAKSHYTGPGGVVATRSGGTVYYRLSDQLNSTARIVNSAGRPNLPSTTSPSAATGVRRLVA